MNIFRDKQIKHFSLFIAIYSILLVGVSTWFSINQLNTAKSMYLEHDRAIVSALLEQEVSKEVIANAISSTDISTAGMEFLDNLGITTNTFGSLLPHFSQFQYHFLRIALGGGICLVIILVIGVISFLQIRNNLYRQSGKIIDNYRQLIKMIIAEAGTYAISGVIWGCIIGLPMHWVIYVSLITNIWGTAWSVPFIPLILIIAIVLLTSLLAVKGPAKRLQRMSIVENISAQ